MSSAISVSGLSKQYLLGGRRRRHYETLRETLLTGLTRRLRSLRGDAEYASQEERFWALRDVSFEVKVGEVVGIIGRNGAGKSTLLKILSRITAPTTGRVRIKGRVGSLLEVGTGFHPELTGRENIFLNGAILGMTKADIRKRFDEIVAFAEIEEFLDTPVKRYSSGMYVRLAFAVAAHLEPDILVVDEVLAVGDLEFQKKCLSKMDQSANSGRTILFVSHDMRRAAALCQRGILLNAGRIECEGTISEVADRYMMQRVVAGGFADLTTRGDHTGSGEAQFQSIALLNDGTTSQTFIFGQPFVLKIKIGVRSRIGEAMIASTITTLEGTPVYQFMNVDNGFNWVADVGEHDFTVAIDKLNLYPGTYAINLWLGDRRFARVDHLPQAITFNVIQDTESGFVRMVDTTDGLVFQPARWSRETSGLRQTGETARRLTKAR